MAPPIKFSTRSGAANRARSSAPRDSYGHIVALKRIDGAGAGHLAAEVALSQRLNHPGLVSLFESGVLDGHPFLAMALIEGPTLKAVMAARRLPLAQSLSIIASVAETLAKLHEAGAVHRDIKPGNIMLRGGADPVVMDLGVAALSNDDAQRGRDLVGSPGYLAPELLDDQPFDGEADVFALGVVLYMLVTDRRPFNGTADAVMDQIRTIEPVRPSAINPTLPRVLDDVIAHALAKNQDRRLSALDFATALRKI